MDVVHIKCPTCHADLAIDRELLNHEVECGDCREVFIASAAKTAKAKGVVVEVEETPEKREEPTSRSRPKERKGRLVRREEPDEDWDFDDDDRRAGYGRNTQRRSRLTYILLALFLGSLGVHNFYAGRTAVAIVQLLITALSIPLTCVFIGIFTVWIPWIWAIVDIIVVDRDGEGVLMKS